MSELPIAPGAGYAEVNWGRWIIRCGRPLCRSALTLGPDITLDDGTIRRGVAWGDRAVRCWDCDFVTGPIAWPRDPGAIEMLLRARPDVATRSWLPGETLLDLLAENASHGLVDADSPALAGRAPLMVVAGERMVGGTLIHALPAIDSRRVLAEARAHAYAPLAELEG